MSAPGPSGHGLDQHLFLVFLTACLVGIGAGVLYALGGDNPYHAVVKGLMAGGGTFVALFFLLGINRRHKCEDDPDKHDCNGSS